MKFQYFAGEQRSPEWFKLRLGIPTASRLADWLAVSKAKGKEGKPLKARLDYEKELMFERQFGVSYDRFVTPAMQDGIDFEDFIIKEYEKQTGYQVFPVGAWYNDHFMASPDGGVYYLETKETNKRFGEIVNAEASMDIENPIGIVEAKIVKDNSFADILENGVPDKHWKQIQGQLWSSKAEWCDYIAGNLNTKKFKVVRVLPDKEFFEWLEVALLERLTVPEFDSEGMFDIQQEIPSGDFSMMDDKSDSNFNF